MSNELNWKVMELDEKKLWPKSTLVSLSTPHIDKRGSIQGIVNLPVKNVTLITSKKGSVRSNHYHKTDWHYMYILSGKIKYYHRPTGSNLSPMEIFVKQGDLIFTPPMEDHTTVFLEDTSLLAISRNLRDQESYENDVVRVTLIDDKNIP
ncbi:MAG: hypothetical protein LBL40_00270 [Coxiellaceae bacterium]|jgi:quercetin dioxygenase-like cupin family protein|nr:hypothetical protein [Coxiellaceae bacterium]